MKFYCICIKIIKDICMETDLKITRGSWSFHYMIVYFRIKLRDYFNRREVSMSCYYMIIHLELELNCEIQSYEPNIIYL